MYLVMTAKTVTALDWTTNKLSHKIYQISVWGGGSPNPQLIILNFVDKRRNKNCTNRELNPGQNDGNVPFYL